MNQEIKVSVIMLAYNIGSYLEEAIRGVVRQQTSYPVQLVIAEDCSTDNTLEICLRYQQQYPDIITLVRHEQNAGLQRNFIDAHRHCVGEYIAICDGDDYWTDKHKLQKMTDFMDSHPDYSTCFHRVVNYYEEDGSKSLSNGKQKKVTTVIDLARSNFITNSSSLFRRKYYPEVPAWFAQITSCDYAMHLLNAQHGPIYYFRKPMAVYRKHGKGIWSEAASDKRLNASLDAREHLLEYFKNQKEVYDTLRGAYRQIIVALLQYYHSVGDKVKIEASHQRIRPYFPEYTNKEIESLQYQLSVPTFNVRLRQITVTCLKRCRQVVSRFIPLPRMR